MSEDGQRGSGSGGTAHRGRPGAGQARQNGGGESPPDDSQDHAGTPRPHALIPALDEGQLAALREIGREWDRVSADLQVWRQALPADPSLGEYPEASEVRPALFTPFVPAAGQGGQLPPIQTTSASETPFTPLGRPGMKRLVFGPPLDATAITAERMRKLLALRCCRRTRCPRSPTGPRRCWPSWSWPASRLVVLAARRRGGRVPDAGGRDLLPPDDPGLPARRRVLIVASEGTRPRPRRAGQLPLDPARATAGPHTDRRRPGARGPALVTPHSARARRREAAARTAVPSTGGRHQRALGRTRTR
jgi:hypothetical protein